MKPDYQATLGQKEYQNGFKGIDFDDLDAVTARYHVLAATGHKDDKDSGGNALRGQWSQKRLNVQMEPLPELIHPPSIDLSQLPLGSFFIQFEFKLIKPYISRDDNQFYIVDNPIVREKVFRYPMVRATAWKGSLRHALWQLGYQEEDAQLRRLFGTANNDKPEKGNGGRLYFHPTFFTQTNLEVINPHDRERRVGKNPILIESVPIRATGVFTLLYAPLDLIGKDAAETRRQISADLQLAAQGLAALFTVHGFGAKTSSGFGLAMDAVRDGIIVVGGLAYESESATTEKTATAPPQPDLPRYLSTPGRLSPDFASEIGSLKSESEYQKLVEGRGQKYAKKDKQLYGKAKSWWGREGQTLIEQRPEPEVAPEPVPKAPSPYPLAREPFTTFKELPTNAKKLADALHQTGGDI